MATSNNVTSAYANFLWNTAFQVSLFSDNHAWCHLIGQRIFPFEPALSFEYDVPSVVFTCSNALLKLSRLEVSLAPTPRWLMGRILTALRPLICYPRGVCYRSAIQTAKLHRSDGKVCAAGPHRVWTQGMGRPDLAGRTNLSVTSRHLIGDEWTTNVGLDTVIAT